ncbi:MAG TPA: hypothetical protein VGN69_07475 [Solirubrobacteraceae bacterium]|jgi:hypothetical protein|nr:hypothetical protein [Solirubrobacteraceae bacterium]
MGADANALRWTGEPGHYEVYYLSVTDPSSGWGVWIRYTMLAPTGPRGQPATASLWLMAMPPSQTQRGPAPGEPLGRKVDYPIGELRAESAPFALSIGEATLSNRGMRGAFADVAWELSWEPRLAAYHHVHPVLSRLGVAQTTLTLPHADLEVSGTVRLGERQLELDGARGGQAHLWGSKHARRWAWAHCNALCGLDGGPRPGSFVDGVSVFVSRLGREVGPSTPLVARLLDEDFTSVSPLRVSTNASQFGLTSWHFEARDGARRLVGQVDAPRPSLVGVTYHDPDGELAYCYNSEVASMRLWVWDRTRGAGWKLRDTLQSAGGAHFEYAQRTVIPELTVHVT